jgi:inorganic pyrophosphatase
MEYVFILPNPGETDWKILAIDVNDPLAEKLNGGWMTLV